MTFTGRLVPRLPAAQKPSPCAVPAAPSVSSPDGAVFSHFTETCLDAPVQAVRPAGGNPIEAGRTLTLSDHTLILLRAIANYEQCSNEHAVALALADYATKIGAGPLARAVLDERERLVAAGRGLRPAVDDVPDDLGDLPEFVRRDEVRFSGAREAHRNGSQGMRR